MSQVAIPRAAERRQRVAERRLWRLGERPLFWLFPLTLLLVVLYLFPAIDVVRFSFTDATLLNPDYTYTLQSYQAVVANPDLPQILSATLIFVVTSVVLQLVLGLMVALALYRG